jgi:hypothetical protein
MKKVVETDLLHVALPGFPAADLFHCRVCHERDPTGGNASETTATCVSSAPIRRPISNSRRIEKAACRRAIEPRRAGAGTHNH